MQVMWDAKESVRKGFSVKHNTRPILGNWRPGEEESDRRLGKGRRCWLGDTKDLASGLFE